MFKQKPILYSAPGCPYCVALKHFLEEKGIDFELIDISKDLKAGQRIIEQTGQMGVPVLEYKGEFVVGFNRQKIVKLLAIE